MSSLSITAPEAQRPDPEAAPRQRLVPNLVSVAKSTRQLMALKLASIDVLVGQDQLLGVLDAETARSVLDIATELAVRPSTVSKMLDQVGRKGWTVRQGDQDDRRKTMVRLTPEGVRIQEEVRRVWNRLESELTDGLDNDAAEMIAHIATLEALLAKRLSRLR